MVWKKVGCVDLRSVFAQVKHSRFSLLLFFFFFYPFYYILKKYKLYFLIISYTCAAAKLVVLGSYFPQTFWLRSEVICRSGGTGKGGRVDDGDWLGRLNTRREKAWETLPPNPSLFYVEQDASNYTTAFHAILNGIAWSLMSQIYMKYDKFWLAMCCTRYKTISIIILYIKIDNCVLTRKKPSIYMYIKHPPANFSEWEDKNLGDVHI